jgi:predicted dehydrogenase
MPRQSRREFLKSSAAFAGATFAIGGTKSSGNILQNSETVRVAVAGVNGRGGSHISSLLELPNVEVAYIVDPDKRIWPGRIKSIADKTGKAPKAITDIREALDDKNLHAVTVATPNHWHSLITIWACQAGKDVYVEKPCSHNVREGRIAVEMARKHKCIVQHGTQSRSEGGWANVVAAIKSGELGKLLVSRGLCYKNRPSIGFKPETTAPPEVDFNLWLGPAQERPYHQNLVHYNWHYFWDFGNGDLGNQGVHQMDIARWAIPGATLPKSVLCFGGRFGYEDQGESANTQVAVMDYGETKLVFEVRGLPTVDYQGQKVGNIFHLEAGTIVGTKFFPKGSDKEAPLPKADPQRGPGKSHFANFVEAVRSRKSSDLNADILEGHYSSALCHLANISYRLGSPAAFKPRAEVAGKLEVLNESLDRMELHLEANKVDLGSTKLRVGQLLTVDAATESFVGNSEANKLLTRNYRKPFVVPEKVV